METWGEIKKEIEENELVDWGQIRIWVKGLSDIERGKMLIDTSTITESRISEQLETSEYYKQPEVMEALKEEQLLRMKNINVE